jgi:hypothetical protein
VGIERECNVQKKKRKKKKKGVLATANRGRACTTRQGCQLAPWLAA